MGDIGTMKFTPEQLIHHAVEAQDALRQAEEDLIEARGSLCQFVRNALAGGVPAERLAEKLGLSRARIYQLRDGKR